MPKAARGQAEAECLTTHVLHVLRPCNRRNATPDIKPPDIYPFKSPRDVEFVARSARVWVDRYTLDKEAVSRAEEIIKVRFQAYCWPEAAATHAHSTTQHGIEHNREEQYIQQQ